MQDYKAFTAELFVLDIRTKEQFVSTDEKIIADYVDSPLDYPEDTDARLHPNCHRATFLNIDHYSQKYFTDLYDKKLENLMEMANIDLSLLPDEQIGRLLIDIKNKRDRLTRLLKKAMEYKKAVTRNTVDQLPTLFLELHLLDSFLTKNRPQGSTDVRFAHNLTDAIMCKRDWASVLIKKIESRLIVPVAITDSTLVENVAEGKINKFNSMLLTEVEKWFMQLTQNSKNGSPFLTNKQVELFIGRAFIGNDSIQKLTLNFGPGEKLALWKLFYRYYERCVSIDNGVERGVQCRDSYIKLLTDNFTNFTFDEVKANFSKSNQAKKEWNLQK